MMPSPPTPSSRSRAVLTIGVLLIAAAGCGLLRGPSAPRTEFYVLSAVPPSDAAPTGRQLVLGLGPVTIPSYLNRPEMVARVAPNQLWFDEFNRWAEPLKDNLVNVLATELDARLGLERVIRYPWYSTTPMDYVVIVTVQRFETQPNGDVVLDARWGVGDGQGHDLSNRDSHFSRPGGQSAAVAAAMSALLGDLASEISASVRQAVAARGSEGSRVRGSQGSSSSVTR